MLEDVVRDCVYFVPAKINRLEFWIFGPYDVIECYDGISDKHGSEAGYDFGKTVKFLRKRERNIPQFNTAAHAAMTYRSRDLTMKVNKFFREHDLKGNLKELSRILKLNCHQDHINQYIDLVNKDPINKVSETFSRVVREFPSYADTMAKILGKFNDQLVNLTVNRVLDTHTYPFEIEMFAKVLNTYPEHYDAICRAILLNEKVTTGAYADLYLAEEKIKNSKNPMELIWYYIDGDYHNLKNIMGMDPSSDDIDVAMKTYQFIQEMHIKRSPEELLQIHEGFYEEMGRAVRQGESESEKRKYLKTYCKEVIAKMKEDAEELMICH